MADHYNYYPLKQFAAIVAECMEISLPDEFAPPVKWACQVLKERLGGTADRAILYHADAVGMHIWQKHPYLFAPVQQHTSLALPFVSTIESVTPVAHASMYTGLDPEGHGIVTYARPQLACTTLFDVLIKDGKKPAILAYKGSTFDYIFNGRDMDYFFINNTVEMEEKALELIASDKYDVISIHACAYDTAAHTYGPEAKESLNILAREAEIFQHIAEAMDKYKGTHRTLLAYAPDHGQHLLPGGNGQHGSKMIEDMNIVHFFGTK
ncbi:MAG: alkaline phosphatase family protein [Clostridia bacterium]|nr:alkaline phosphatase family protein [Clostridia bacterium]